MSEHEKKDEETPVEAPAETSAVEPVEDDSTPFDDERTGRAIDDIVAHESDELLQAQDASIKEQNQTEPKRGFLGRLVRNKWVRRLTLLIILGGIGAAAGVPTSRYYILNAAGVRVSSSVVVTDKTTQLPLKGVPVVIGGVRVETDTEGKARVTGLKLGPSTLDIKQVGFAEIKKKVVLGWGSNPLGGYELEAVGVQYTIEVRDYLSDKPIEGVEASNGEASATSGKDGKITLTLGEAIGPNDTVALAKGNYRTEQVALNPDPKVPNKVALVLARKAVFVTKQSGKYDVYKSDLDGKNRQILLPGTGRENNNISLVTSPDGSRAAIVSTREDKRDKEGFLLSTLTIIEVENGETFNIAQAPQIQLIDWIGPRLIFEQVSSDSSATNRYMVVGYNPTDNSRVQLAASKKLGPVLSAQGGIYYVVDADADDAAVQPGMYKINPDGNGKHIAVKGEIWSVLRTTFNTINLQMADDTWQSYNTQNGAVVELDAPTSLAGRLYIDNADHSKSLWVNQSALTIYDVATNKDTVAQTKAGLAYPVQWLTPSAVLYRISSGGETSDYAASLEGGTPHKVSDVSGTYGFAQGQ